MTDARRTKETNNGIRVGDRVRWTLGNDTRGVMTVTEITERGFRWVLDDPVCIHPLFGSYKEGESYDPEHYEVVSKTSDKTAAVTSKQNHVFCCDNDDKCGGACECQCHALVAQLDRLTAELSSSQHCYKVLDERREQLQAERDRLTAENGDLKAAMSRHANRVLELTVADLYGQRDRLREELVKLREHLKQVDAVVQTALRSATSREAMLREALAKHGRHGRDCDITLYGNDPGVIIECTCGLDDALAGAADEPSEYHPLPFWHECEHFAGWTRDADYQCQNCAPPEFEAL